MKLEEAIERIYHFVVTHNTTLAPDDKVAFKVSIDATKTIIDFRNTHVAGYIPPLAGETKD